MREGKAADQLADTFATIPTLFIALISPAGVTAADMSGIAPG